MRAAARHDRLVRMTTRTELPVVIAPEPIDLPRPGFARGLRRMARIAALGTRHMPPVVARKLVRREGNPARAGRLVFQGLGATYVKFGQFVASAPSLVGEKTAQEFRGCLDSGPAVPFDQVRRAVEAEIGRPITDAFTRFDREPMASASIAVVHRAQLRDGTDVAVKVLRPGIEQMVATDLAMLERTARFMAARGIDQAYNLVALVVGLKMQIAEELDLRNEARTMDTFRALFREFGLSLLVVPQVHRDLSGRRVLAMDLLDGTPLDDLPSAQRAGVDPAPLVRELLRAWVLTALRANAFHADIHAGNLLLLRDGRLGMLDWGIIAQLDEDSRLMFRRLCEATTGDEGAWDDIGAMVIKNSGPSLQAMGLTDEQIHRFAREMFEPALTKPLSEVSMASLMMNGDDVVRMATGAAPSRKTWRDRRNLMREAAKAYRAAAAAGTFELPTMRMGFLSMKQLVYLERYGRMYIPEEALLGDPAFVRAALADAPPLASPAGASSNAAEPQPTQGSQPPAAATAAS
jgi:predicted unusual protein kinase regulating ubiquinone biosynthesis (AarF/ABC1/UbiB family)